MATLLHSMIDESYAVNLCILKPSIATRHGVITFMYTYAGILKSGIEMRHV